MLVVIGSDVPEAHRVFHQRHCGCGQPYVCQFKDQIALSEMENSVNLVNGHHQLVLPSRHNSVNLSNNHEFALGKLQYLKKDSSVTFTSSRSTGTHSYVSSSYTRQVPCNQQEAVKDTPVWYLPHHPVFYPWKPGKMRVVFDEEPSLKVPP